MLLSTTIKTKQSNIEVNQRIYNYLQDAIDNNPELIQVMMRLLKKDSLEDLTAVELYYLFEYIVQEEFKTDDE